VKSKNRNLYNFPDERIIVVESGSGGPGCSAFHREKYVKKGGPDGGNGGDGGAITFHVNPRLRSLKHLHHSKTFKAESGSPGRRNKQSGANGKNLVISLPPGTQVFDADTGDLLFDFSERKEMEVIYLAGGRGGLGNMNFATSVNQAPVYAQQGLPGQSCRIRLDLKIVADIGIIGMPSVGKSSLLKTITNASPKIGTYDFTTVRPNLGIITDDYYRRYSIIDVPGIVDGSSKGSGLGLAFLKHLERVSMLLLLLDINSIQVENDFKILLREIHNYNKNLAELPRLIILNKIDLVDDISLVDEIRTDLENGVLSGERIGIISAKTGENINLVKSQILDLLAAENLTKNE
jgi:GTP-binding protein